MPSAEPPIPILDLAPEIDALWDEINAAIQDVLRSTRFIGGPAVSDFEAQVADFLGVPHAIGVNSGTDALVIALRALDIGPGDEVITTAFTFFATGESISNVGATPVFVDIDPLTLNMDVNAIEAAITPRTRAMMPVHLYGQAVEMDPLLALAEAHNLTVIEDVAQAFGGGYRGRQLGTLGHMGAFSFFPSKNLGAYGDAGLIVTHDEALAQSARKLRAHGGLKKYHNEMLGYNSRLDALQAAILSVKLPHVPAYNEGRRRVAQQYHEAFADLPGVTPPLAPDHITHVYHQYTLRIAEQRDHVREELARQGISTMIYYPVPLHRLPVYQAMQVSLPETERAAQDVLSLPIWPQMPPATQERVIKAVREAVLSGVRA